MPETQLGQRVAGWSASAKEEFRADLDKLTKLPPNVLRSVIDKFAKTHPACNPVELAALEAEQSAIADPQALTDAVSAFSYIWENMDGESPQAVTADLKSNGLLTNDTAGILLELLTSAEPFRETAKVKSSYIRIGAPLFASVRGAVDLRLRFHKKDEEFVIGVPPKELVGAQQVVMVDLVLNENGNHERTISFLMDENDLGYMKRFVRNMERELELSKGLLKAAESKGNG